MKKIAIPLLLIFSFVTVQSQTSGQKVYAPDAASGDNFGSGVSLYDDYAIIGAVNAYNDVSDDNDAGVAYIYKRTGDEWVFHQKIAEAGIATYDDFGFAVDLSDTYAAIGAPLTNYGGSVFVYKRNGDQWERQCSLPEHYRSDFGTSVSMDNTTIVVGAPDSKGWGPSWSDQGAAWVYTLVENEGVESWEEVSMIAASDGYRNGHFGYDVDISGDYIIAGAWTSSADYPGRSAAYIYENEDGNWIEKQRLFPAGTDTTESHFGMCVSISGDLAAVGAPKEKNDTVLNGAVYIFERSNNGWEETAKLLSPYPDTSIVWNFGRAVDLQGRRILIGAYNAVYVFEKKEQSWQLSDSIHHDYHNNGMAYHNFGTKISLSDSTYLVGAYEDCDLASIAGAAHFYNMRFLAPTNVPGEKTQGSFVVFPNPVHSTLKIKDMNGVKQITIYNLSGIRLRTIEISRSDTSTTEIDFSAFERGFYLLRILDQNNEYSTVKVVKY